MQEATQKHPNEKNNRPSHQQEQAKEVLTHALMGDKDIHESIESLAEILFPGENLLEAIKTLKIQSELNTRLKAFADKLSVEDVQKEGDVFEIELNFTSVVSFLNVQSKVMDSLKTVSKKHAVKLSASFSINETIDPFQASNTKHNKGTLK